ncbi:MAG: PAS domain-containing protein [Opitutae bacterium]|nr:PAS domain-containing protein [Opitutae bacterium]
MLRLFSHRFGSLKGRLVLLGAVVVLASSVLGAALTYRAYLHERDAITRDLRNTSQAVATLIDQEIKSHERFLRTLATADALERDDFAGFYERAAKIASGTSRWIVVVDETGQQLVNTRLPFGTPLPRTQLAVGAVEAWRADRAFVSGVTLGTVTKDYVLAVSVPHRRDGKLRYAVALVMTPHAFVEGIDLRQIAPGYVMSVVDSAGTIVWRNLSAQKFIGHKATPDVVQAVLRRVPYVAPSRTLEGIDVITAVSHSPHSRWATVVGAPIALLESSAKHLVWLGLGITLGTLAVTAALAWWIGRAVLGDVTALVSDAEKFGRGMLPPTRPWALIDTATVAHTLRRTLTQLHTELKHRTEAEAAMRQIEQRFRLAVAVDQLTLFEQDEDLRYTWLHPEHAEHRHALGHTDAELAERGEAASLVRLKREVIATGEPRHGEVSVPLARGLRHYSLFMTPKRDTVGKVVGVAGAAVDITERKNAEQALERAQAELRQANVELESKVRERTASLHTLVRQMEEFTYSVSHDLRAPIRAIAGFSGVLLEDHSARLDAEGRAILERIMRSSERMDRLITDLLAFSRLSRHEVELTPVSPAEILREIVIDHPELQSPLATLTIAPDLPTVLAQPALLHTVGSNLLTNAAKFVRRGETPRILIHAEKRDGVARLWFCDAGIGIRPELQPRLFRIFERLHNEDYAGTGIGLAMVRRAVERMHGTVGVESDGVHGSRFWIELRLAPVAVAREPAVLV